MFISANLICTLNFCIQTSFKFDTKCHSHNFEGADSGADPELDILDPYLN